jgi:hypothetical protein
MLNLSAKFNDKMDYFLFPAKVRAFCANVGEKATKNYLKFSAKGQRVFA